MNNSHLSAEQRRQVLLVGTCLSDEAKRVCGSQGLSLKVVALDEVVSDLAKSRALIIEIEPKQTPDADMLSQVISCAMKNGLKVILISALPPQDKHNNNLPHETVILVQKQAQEIRARHSEVSFEWYLSRAVAEASKHDPGAAANVNLQVQVRGEPPDDEQLTLIQRAFYDLTGVSICKLSGGKSGASVWEVQPCNEDRGYCDLCVIAKIQEVGRSDSEARNFGSINMSFLNDHRAYLYAEKSRRGHRYGISVYQKVANGRSFGSLVKAKPQSVIESLFELTFQSAWFRSVQVTEVIGPRIGASGLKILRTDSRELWEAASYARATRADLPDSAQLLGDFETLPKIRFQTSTVHGDLHPGNIFVVEEGGYCVLIDFGRSARYALTVADPACLEVSLTFPSSPEFDLSLLDSKEWMRWVRERYSYPLSTPTSVAPPDNLAWLDSAVTAIRGKVELLESNNPYPYAITVAAYLLRCASYEDHNIRQRALAYELACGLIQEVKEALT